MEILNFNRQYSEFENYRRSVIAYREFGDSYEIFSSLKIWWFVIQRPDYCYEI